MKGVRVSELYFMSGRQVRFFFSGLRINKCDANIRMHANDTNRIRICIFIRIIRFYSHIIRIIILGASRRSASGQYGAYLDQQYPTYRG